MSAKEDKSQSIPGSNGDPPVGATFQEVMRDPTERGARLRADWRSSSERRTMLLAAAAIIVAVVVSTAGALIWANATSSDYEYEATTRVVLWGGLAFTISGYAGVFLFFLLRRQQQRAWYDRAVVLQAAIALREAEEATGMSNLDLSSLWTLNQKRLDYYHKIATSQSEKSFTYGVIAAAVGFFVLIFAVVVAALADSATGSIAAGVIGVVGSSLSAYLGATFMRLQETSTAQLRALFSQPLEFSRYLAAERLLASLKTRNREPATRELIRSLARGEAPEGSG